MDVQVKYRKAIETDLESILEILNYQIIHSTSVYDYHPKTIDDLLPWFQEKEKKGFPLFVAIDENQVIGYATYGDFRFKEGYRFTVEHSIYIHHYYSGKGIGSELMKLLVASAQQNGIHVMIGGIDAANTGSLRFHEQFGFEAVGHLKQVGFKFDRWLDVIFMQKIL